MIEVKGLDGESIVFDGTTVAKWRHGGKQEVARNLATTFRQCDVTVRKKGRKERDLPDRYDVMLACSAFFSLTIEADQRPLLDELVAALEASR